MSASFIQQDPSIERRRKLAEALLANRKTGPVRTGMEGLGRLAQQLSAAYGVRQANKAGQEYNTKAQADLERILSDYGQDVRPLSQHPGTADIAAQIQLKQMESDRAAESARSSRISSLEDYGIKKQIDQQYAKPEKGTSAMQNASALGYKPGTPEYNQYITDTTKKTPLVTMGEKSTPLQKELAKINAKDFSQWRTEAVAAGKIEPYLDQMESLAEQFETGRSEQALASLGQWLGTDSGAALQAFKATQVPIMLQLAESVSGPMTEKEWDMLRESLPNFGTDPRANKIVLRLLRKGAEGTKQNYAEAEAYIKNNNGSLAGYTPHYAAKAKTDGEWILMEDAAGNKALVNSKTNEVKEIQ